MALTGLGEASGFFPGGGAGDGVGEIVFSFGHVDMMHKVTDISGTKSSHRWAVPPYNHDRLHGDMIFLSENRWGLPDLPAVDCVPVRLIAFSDSRGSPEPGVVHFFLDDYRFETVWTSPFRSLARLQRLGQVLSPDFSLWPQMPLAMQLWQVYRSRWMGAFWTMAGLTVIPTVQWAAGGGGEPGVQPAGAAAALDAGAEPDGLQGAGAGGIRAGLELVLEELKPERLLVCGRHTIKTDRCGSAR